jgi:hypothetical protein
MNRYARKREVRAVTIAMDRQPKYELHRLRDEEPDDGLHRLPLVRGDCEKQERPCPYVSCRHHLFLGVDPHTGNLKLNFPDLFDEDGTPRLDEMPATCALDVAERDGVTLETLGELLNVTRERARQREVKALSHLRQKLAALEGLESHMPETTVGIFENPYTDGALVD